MEKLRRTAKNAGQTARVAMGAGLALVATVLANKLMDDTRLFGRRPPLSRVASAWENRSHVPVYLVSARTSLQESQEPDSARTAKARKLEAVAKALESQARRTEASGNGTAEEIRLMIHDYDQAAGAYVALEEPKNALAARWKQLGAAQQLPSHTGLGFRNKERDEQVGLALSAIKQLNEQLLGEMRGLVRHREQ